MKQIIFLVIICLFTTACSERGNQVVALKLHVVENQTSSGACSQQIEEIFLQRLKNFGVSNSDVIIRRKGQEVSIKVGGLHDAERVAKLIYTPGNIAFWETYENNEIYGYLAEANRMLGEAVMSTIPEEKLAELKAADKVPELVEDLVGDTITDDELLSVSDELNNLRNPLFAALTPAASGDGQLHQGPVIGYALESDTAQVNRYLKMQEVASIFPRNLRLRWSAKPIDAESDELVFMLVAIKVMSRDGAPTLDGSFLEKSEGAMNQFSESPEITMKMNREGAAVWQRMTRSNIGRSIAITIDNEVFSFPTVQAEIQGGYSSITGNFTPDEAQDLANVLNCQPLPCTIRLLHKDVRVLK